MPTPVRELVKTYKLLNDPNAPSWSIRFVGAVAAVAILLAGAVAILWVSSDHGAGPAPNALLATTQQNADGSRTDYVGFDPTHFDPTLGYDPARVDQMVTDWDAMHQDATVLAKQPVWSGSHVVGYDITYR